MANSQAFYFKSGDVVRVSLTNNDGSDLSAGDPVERTSGGFQSVQSNGNAIQGVLAEDIANGNTGAVDIINGAVFEADLTSGFDPNIGDEVDVNTSNELKSQAGTAIGFIVGWDPSSGENNVLAYLYPAS